jgi:hypothetical protein
MDLLRWEIYGEIFFCTLRMSLFHITIMNESPLFQIVSHTNHKNAEQSTIERSYYHTRWRNTA